MAGVETKPGDTMPAAVYQGDKRLTVERLPVPEPKPHEVLLEVSHCGVCGSDLHMVLEGWGSPGSTGGHEYSGVIVAVGDDVVGWDVGDRVVGGPEGGCRSCPPCLRGRPQLCLERSRAGMGDFQGAFATYTAVSQRALYRVPDDVDLRTAALTEPLAVALHGIGRAPVEPGARVLVTGAGPIGLLTVAALRALGVDDITVSEPGGRRRERAEAAGAAVTVTPDSLVAPAMPMDLVDQPFDAAYECAGRADAIEACLGQLGRGGSLVIVGAGIRRPRLDPNRILMNELVVTGGYEYSPDDFVHALDLLAGGRLPVGLLIEPDDVALDGLFEAMGKLAAGELAGKVMVVPGA